jgi:hypothetical protein
MIATIFHDSLVRQSFLRNSAVWALVGLLAIGVVVAATFQSSLLQLPSCGGYFCMVIIVGSVITAAQAALLYAFCGALSYFLPLARLGIVLFFAITEASIGRHLIALGAGT